MSQIQTGFMSSYSNTFSDFAFVCVMANQYECKGNTLYLYFILNVCLACSRFDVSCHLHTGMLAVCD